MNLPNDELKNIRNIKGIEMLKKKKKKQSHRIQINFRVAKFQRHNQENVHFMQTHARPQTQRYFPTMTSKLILLGSKYTSVS